MTARSLEVTQFFRHVALDVRHVPWGTDAVRLASTPPWQWRVLGVPLHRIDGRLGWLLRYAPPILSDADVDAADTWLVPDDVLDGETHELVTWEAGAGRVVAPPGWSVATSAPGDALVPERDDVVELARGDLRFRIRVVEAPRGITERPDEIDWPYLSLMTTLCGVGSVFAAFTFFAPPPVQTTIREDVERRIEAQLAVITPPEPIPAVSAPDEPQASPAEGARAPEPEGRRGKRDAPDRPDRSEARQRSRDRDVAMGAGVLGAWAEVGGELGESGISGDLADSVGLVRGPRQAGLGWGLGLRGRNLGGGGVEGGDGLGLRGNGPGGNPFGDGDGSSPVAGSGKREGELTTEGPQTVLGPIDRSLIAEVVQRNLPQIRYCYQRQLQHDPELAGKVVVKFTIAQDGSVSSATTKESTLNHPSVESCINGRFLRMTFPELPTGVAVVTYPFFFSPG
jgi:hypothetical protein